MKEVYNRMGGHANVVMVAVLVWMGMVELGGCAKCMMSAPPPKVVAMEALTGRFPSATFTRAFERWWSPDHQHLSHNHLNISLSLDNHSSPSPFNFSSSNFQGTGFKSKLAYIHGFFNVGIKLSSKPYIGGVVSSFYLSNLELYPNEYDEVKFEFLGRAYGEEYILQTNVYSNGSTDTGREQRLRLWFDPTIDFHNYSIVWTSNHTMLFIDDIPIREFPRVNHGMRNYLTKPMSIYATISDGSDWATNGGKDKINYAYAPFIVEYSNFILSGCRAPSTTMNIEPYVAHCDHEFTLLPTKLTHHQHKSMNWVQHNFMTYNYCDDYQRYPNRLPDCPQLSIEEIDL